MQRYTISLDDELADWVESQAETRGVSKAKVIRDAITAAHDRGSTVYPDELVERVDRLERRLEELEGSQIGFDDSDQSAEFTSADQNDSDTTEDPILETFRNVMEDRPPHTAHGMAAVVTTLQILRKQGPEPMKTGQLREAVYEQHSDQYSSARSMWQSIQRYFEDIPGIEKVGYGKWEYAGDEAIRDEVRIPE